MKLERSLRVLFGKTFLTGITGAITTLVPLPCNGQGYLISTVAGGNPYIFASSPYVFAPSIGDGREAASAQLNAPVAVATGNAGDVYIADTGDNLIRHVAANGIISTVAGSSSLAGGFSGDGGPATSALLHAPTGVAVDAAGNLYIADRLNSRIRKVDGNGIITTVVGGGSYSGSDVGDGGPATSASLSVPWAVALDSGGNLYISDTGHSRVRRVDSSGIITTVAGNGISGSSGDGGAATSARVAPYGIAIDNRGSLYIADLGGFVRKVTNGTIDSVAGTGAIGYTGDGSAATKAALNQPQAVALDDAGNILIADTGNQVIRKVSSLGVITTIAGSGAIGSYGDGGPAGAATLDYPGVSRGPNGTLFIANAPTNGGYQDSRIRLLTPTSGVAPTIATNGVVPLFGSTTAIAPGSWISIFGTNLASGSSDWNGEFPTKLGNTAVTIDSLPAYLAYVSPTQINAQVPDSTSTGTVVVTVTNPGGSSSQSVNVRQYAPSFSLFSQKYAAGIVLTPGSPGNSGAGYDRIGPTGAFSFPTRPVRAGETLILFGVGFGPTDPVVPAGKAWSGVAPLVDTPGISIGDVPAEVRFSGLVGSGLYQFNVVVPDVGSGDMLLQACANGFRAQKSIFIPVQ